MSRTESADVIVVGAGPTGLLLAGDLAEAGLTVTVLEKRDGTSNLTRAFAVHARTLELLDQRGLADELIASGNPQPRLRLLDRVDVELSVLPSRFPFLLVTPQYRTEAVLRRRAEAAGAVIEHGTRVTGLRQDTTGVDVTVATADGDTTRRAGYVVGTDGHHSTVREAIGLSFRGRLAVGGVMLADVKLADPPDRAASFTGVAEGFAFIASFGRRDDHGHLVETGPAAAVRTDPVAGDGYRAPDPDTADEYWRIICRRTGDTTPEDTPVTLDELRQVVVKAHGTDFGMHDPRWMSRFHSDERQAPHYRVGRVLLAGDAAHVHSPAGGMGMNTGLQDAANLGWKLAATIQGWAPQGLLDSYESERHPVGRQVLRTSGTLLRLVQLRSPVLRAIRNGLSRLIRVPAVAGRLAETISGVGIHYPAPTGAGASAGHRAEDVALAGDSERLYRVLRRGKFVLVTDRPGQRVPEPLVGRLEVVAPRDPDGTALLVRPDGYIAWSGPVEDRPRWPLAGAR